MWFLFPLILEKGFLLFAFTWLLAGAFLSRVFSGRIMRQHVRVSLLICWRYRDDRNEKLHTMPARLQPATVAQRFSGQSLRIHPKLE